MSWGYSKKKHQAYPKRQRIQGVRSSDFNEGITHHNFKKREDLDKLVVADPEREKELEEFAREKMTDLFPIVEEHEYPTQQISFLNPDGRYWVKFAFLIFKA